MASDDIMYCSFIDVSGALYHVALHQNRNVVFIWSVSLCFILCRTEKRHIYATPLRSSYFAWLHYKYNVSSPRYQPIPIHLISKLSNTNDDSKSLNNTIQLNCMHCLLNSVIYLCGPLTLFLGGPVT